MAVRTGMKAAAAFEQPANVGRGASLQPAVIAVALLPIILLGVVAIIALPVVRSPGPKATDGPTAVTVSGSGCPAGSVVAFSVDGQPLSTAVADGEGRFQGQPKIPFVAGNRRPSLSAACGGAVLALAVPTPAYVDTPRSWQAETGLAVALVLLLAVVATIVRRRLPSSRGPNRQ